MTPSSAPISSAAFISPRLRRLEDVTWPILEKFLPFLFSKLCIVFYYRCLKICSPLLAGLCSPPPPLVFRHRRASSLSNKMSPHKMNKRKRLRLYQTSYQALCFERGHRKKREKLFITYTLLCSVSRSVCCHQLFPFLRNAVNI